MKRYLLQAADEGPSRLVRDECPLPEAGEGEALVKIHACSLNYRDLLMKSGQSASGGKGPVVPLSDGAGTVEALGPSAGGWEEGDRVALTFFRDWESGPFRMDYHRSARGGSCDGVLSEWVLAPASSLVRVPEHLDFDEAATLPCAALTAWHALFERGRPLRSGETVLCLGTGGVSVFALQIAKAAGARVIITSSSDEKLARARALGADGTVNYRETPEWDQAVMDLSGGQGADHVVEVGGPGTLGRSLGSVAAGGTVSLIGVLTGFDAPETGLFPLLARNADLNGIYVGNREMFERLNRFLAEHRIRPEIDRRFPFDEAPEAYAHLEGASHFGKVVVSAQIDL